jgi:hypothetical protein
MIWNRISKPAINTYDRGRRTSILILMAYLGTGNINFAPVALFSSWWVVH